MRNNSKSRSKKTRIFTKFYLLCLFSGFFYTSSACAGLAIIRDVETEKFLYDLSRPIFLAANLDPKNIKIYIVNDSSINAFVSGGQNIFINTGLIRKYKTPDALIGVIAHETGHIAAGHLARSSEAMQNAGDFAALSYLLGIGAIIAGSPEAGQALIIGGAQSNQRILMKFTREQEEAADKYAIEYLEKISYPIDGLVELLQFFQREMIGYGDMIDEYLLSHPVSQKRIDVIKARTGDWRFSDKNINQKLQNRMDRILAKLEGFIDDPNKILQNESKDELANYRKSIAYYRKGDVKKSLQLLENYLVKNPQDPFLLELKGQILFENSNIEQALIAYNKALQVLDKHDAPLIRIAFAGALVAIKNSDVDLLKLAIKNLKLAQESESDNPLLYKYLAAAYNKINDEGRSLLALSEFNCLIGEQEKCLKYAKEAKDKLDKSAKNEIARALEIIEENNK